ILGNLQKINLSRDEITSLHTKLGDVLTDGVKKAHDADNILNRLRDAGIDVTDRNKAGLMPLLLMLMSMFGLGGFKKKEA
ncbi:MAG: hypothetical protein NTV98_03685, partial [Candidatus Roizmanbacteria bacterium]|nr:hypothetical protein [Candidatus Roizmanbacteria bacterium]